MKSLNEISLYDIMAEDMDVWLTKNKKFGFNLHIDDEMGTNIVQEDGVHPYAAEALADFCKRYLCMYEKSVKTQAA